MTMGLHIPCATAGDRAGRGRGRLARPITGGASLASGRARRRPDRVPSRSRPRCADGVLMPPGIAIELVASEPLVQEPVAIDWDTDGRLWVVEMPGFMADITGSNEHDPIGRVVVLEDVDADGRMDKRTVFADGPRAGALAEGARSRGAGRRAAERLVDARHRRRSADGHEGARHRPLRPARRRSAEQRERVRLGARQPACTAPGRPSIQLRLKNGTFEEQPTLQRGEWGVTHDDVGSHVSQHERIGSARRSGADAVLRSQSEPAPHARQLRAVRRRQQRSERRSGRSVRTRARIARIRSASIGPMARWSGSPPSARRSSIAAIGCRRRSTATSSSPSRPRTWSAGWSSTTMAARWARARRTERGEFLASTDERFRPVFLSNAPDGTLYVVDMYRGIIEHRLSLTDLPARLHRRQAPRSAHGIRPDLSRRARHDPASDRRAFRAGSAGAARRDAVASERVASRHRAAVAGRAPRSVERSGAGKAGAEREGRRVRACTRSGRWTGSMRSRPPSVDSALADPSRHVRASAIRLAERWLGDGGPSAAVRGVEAARRRGVGGATAARGVDRNTAGRPARDCGDLDARAARRRSRGRRCGVERRARQRGGHPRADVDIRVERGPVRRSSCSRERSCGPGRTRRSNGCSRCLRTTNVRAGSGWRCCRGLKSPCLMQRCRGRRRGTGHEPVLRCHVRRVQEAGLVPVARTRTRRRMIS